MNDKNTRKRETALRNLQKAQEARRGYKKPKSGEAWAASSAARLEKIIERTEKELAKATTTEGADLTKLANALNVCHKAHRQLTGDKERKPMPTTHAELTEYVDTLMKSIVGILKQSPPQFRAKIGGMFAKIIPRGVGKIGEPVVDPGGLSRIE